MRRNAIPKICAATFLTLALAQAAGCSVDATAEPEVLAKQESKLPEAQRVFGDEKGNIYVLTGAGDLLWYADTARNGTAGWGRGSGNRIGRGWIGTANIFSGGNGHIYWVSSTGELKWYRDDAANGNVAWDPNSGARKIGDGWADIKKAFSGGDGVIYVQLNDGHLRYYRHTGRSTGTYEWAGNSGAPLVWNWGNMKHAFTCQDGNIYAVRENGDLVWYRDPNRNGTPIVASPTLLKTGWGSKQHVWCGGSGMIYAVEADGSLRWYRHTPQFGDHSWAAMSGVNAIGTGWLGISARSTAEYPSCGSSNDCPIRQECLAGQCRVIDEARWCEDQHTARNARGDRVDCGSYACENGICRTSCTDSSHCSSAPHWSGEHYSCASNACSYLGPDDPVNGRQVFPGPGENFLPNGVPYRETISARGCSLDSHCPSGSTCVNNACFASVARRCSANRTSTIAWGVSDSCDMFNCEPIGGACFTQCFDSAQCQSGSCNPVTRTCQ